VVNITKTLIELDCQPVRSAYQPPASSTFLSEQTSQQQPANSTFLSQQTSTSHQPPAKRTGCALTISPFWVNVDNPIKVYNLI
jgi:hypothetical protein